MPLSRAFICFPCRKVFKKAHHRRVAGGYAALKIDALCPQCRGNLQAVGDAFKAPVTTDTTAWEEVERDICNGRKFIRDECFGIKVGKIKKAQAPKGVRSLFQVPARKRKRVARVLPQR